MSNDEKRPYLRISEQWTSFVAAFVHELRTPVASLRMLAELLNEPSPIARQDRNYAANIQQVVQEILTLVGDVGELTRLFAGKAPLRIEEVDLPRLVSQVEGVIRPQAWELGIGLLISSDPALPALVSTDRDRLQEILLFLLQAAVHQAKSEVYVRLDMEADRLRIVISSDGLPFSEAAAAKLFEPFGDGARETQPRGGRSLCLPIANELAMALGGALRAGNRHKRPSFTLELPASAPEPPAP